MKQYLILACWLICSLRVIGIHTNVGKDFQFKTDHVESSIIRDVPVNLLIQFKDKSGYTTLNSSKPEWVIAIEPVIENYFIYKLTVLTKEMDIDMTMNFLRELPFVNIVQIDHKIERRNIPNDTLLNNQWQWVNMDAFNAWSITTGGVTVQNDTIVIAIIDDGLDITHEDFQGNVWVNRFEIPGDGIDNDSNGYIDDYWGWNTYENNDSILDPVEKAVHGTPVAGIVGAVGNNITGVSGLNWNIKLMIVVGGGTGLESDALKSFYYVLTQKKRYLETNGAIGAYVVATNGSWGKSRRFPQDAPLWCAFYDTLGKYGIINMAATTNSNENVDIVGDLPTTCTSDYMIAVTNTNKSDQKHFAGYGRESIDLGAPGEGTFTTAFDFNSTDTIWKFYKHFSGTSAASPHVTGIAGLLYAAACDSFITLSKSSPELAAWWIRYFILNGVDVIPEFEDQIASSGRANAYKPLLLMGKWCDGTLITEIDSPDLPVESIMNLYPNPGKDYFEISGLYENMFIKVFDAKGSLIKLEKIYQKGTKRFHLPNIAKGLYFVNVYNSSGRITGRFKWVSVE